MPYFEDIEPGDDIGPVETIATDERVASFEHLSRPVTRSLSSVARPCFRHLNTIIAERRMAAVALAIIAEDSRSVPPPRKRLATYELSSPWLHVSAYGPIKCTA